MVVFEAKGFLACPTRKRHPEGFRGNKPAERSRDNKPTDNKSTDRYRDNKPSDRLRANKYSEGFKPRNIEGFKEHKPREGFR